MNRHIFIIFLLLTLANISYTQVSNDNLKNFELFLEKMKSSLDTKLECPQIINTVTYLLETEKTEIQDKILSKLVVIGKPAIPILSGILQSTKNRDIKEKCIHVFDKVPCEEVINLLIEKLKDEDVRIATIVTLSNIGTDTIPFLIKALHHKERKIRRGAINTLEYFGEKAALALPALIELLNDSEDDVAEEVPFTLSQIGIQAAPALIKAFKDENRKVRRRAFFALERIGIPVIPYLVQTLEDDQCSFPVKRDATRILGNFKSKSYSALPVLVRLLTDSDYRTRSCAASAIGDIGIKSEDAAYALIRLLNDQDIRTQLVAAYALTQIGREDLGNPVLLSALDGSPQDIKSYSIHLLARLGPKASFAIPTIEKMIQEETGEIQKDYSNALSEIRNSILDEQYRASLLEKAKQIDKLMQKEK